MPDMSASEFEYLVALHSLPGTGRFFELRADEKVCKAFAARFDFLALEKLEAKIRVKPLMGGGHYQAKGHVAATIVRQCVVSLQPVVEEAGGAFTILYGVENQGDDKNFKEYSLSDVEPPEPVMPGNRIDIGELAIQQMAFFMEAYPRQKNITLDQVVASLPETLHRHVAFRSENDFPAPPNRFSQKEE